MRFLLQCCGKVLRSLMVFMVVFDYGNGYNARPLEAPMRIDLYTKTILTLIMLLLAVIAIHPLVHPTTAEAQGAFTGVQIATALDSVLFFDTRTGDLWTYSSNKWEHDKLIKFGAPLGK